MRSLRPYLSLQPCLSLMTAKELVKAQIGLNRSFVKRRDRGAIIDDTYGNYILDSLAIFD